MKGVPKAAGKIAAYCDVDGTLARTHIALPLIPLKQRFLPAPSAWFWRMSLLVRGPWWLLVDRFSRSASNRAIYAQYRGLVAERVRAFAGAIYCQEIRPRLFPQALAQLAEFRDRGVGLVFVTGGLDLFMEPMAAEFEAELIAHRLEEVGGVYSGRLTTEPLTGARRADAVRRHAARGGIDLDQSYALGDALGDLAMLETVGRPMAVNPERRLARVAMARRWPIQRWAMG